MKCWLQCTRLSGREKSSLGTAIHFSQLLFLKSDAVRIKNGIEESTVGLRSYLCTSTPWSLTSVSLAAAEPSFITVPPVPRTSRCQSKIKRNHSKYSFSALTVNMKRHQGCKEMWIKTASLPFFLWMIWWLKVFYRNTHRKNDLQADTTQPFACRKKCNKGLLDVVFLPRHCQDLFGLPHPIEIAVCFAEQNNINLQHY